MKPNYLCLLLAAAAHVSVASQPCADAVGVSFSAGQDDRGFFVRAVREDYPPGRGVGRRAIVVGVAEALAGHAGAQVFFCSSNTANRVPMKEWRGDDPLAALRAFGSDAGFEVVKASPNWWVVGWPEYQREADITMSIHPAKPSQGQRLSEAGMREFEDALVRQLQVRTSWQRYGRVSIALSYYWLSDENPHTALIVSELAEEPDSTKVVRKVSITQHANGYEFDCVWEREEVYGPIVPEVDEDFDGDGVHDPVFMGGSCGTKDCDAVILSGATGERLFEFGGNELAVEKSPTGPPRIAAEWSFSVDRGKYLPPGDQAEVRGDRRHLVARFDPATRACLVDVRGGEHAKEHIEASRPGYNRLRTRDVLADVVGGLEKVRVYVFGPSHYDPASTSEQIKIERIFWQLDPPDALGFRHPVYQSRLVFRYRAPEVIEKEKKEKAGQAGQQ